MPSEQERGGYRGDSKKDEAIVAAVAFVMVAISVVAVLFGVFG